MVILVIQNKYVTIQKFECETPVSANQNRPAILGTTFKWMKSVTWNVKVVDNQRRIQSSELHP